MMPGPRRRTAINLLSRAAALGFLAAAISAADPTSAAAQRRPDPPEDLEAEAVSATQIDLDWERGSGGATPVNYNVYRDGLRVASSGQTSYSDTGLAASTQYSYFVTAVDDKNRESDPSGTVTATTFDDDTPPSRPEELRASTISSTRIDLNWASATDPESGIAAYRIYRNGNLVGSSNGTVFEDTNLQSFTVYEYRVSAVNGVGLEGPTSEPAEAQTLDGTPPTRPLGLLADALSSTEVNLVWSASLDPETGVSEYRVYRDGDLVASASDTLYADSGLLPEAEYEYRVSAVNGGGLESETSDPVKAQTPPAIDPTPPTAPEDVTATPVSPTQIDLTWGPATDPETGVGSYRVYRDGTLAGTAVETAWADIGRLPGTAYTYEVSAVNGDGLEGPASGPATAMTPSVVDSVPPAPPTGLRVLSP